MLASTLLSGKSKNSAYCAVSSMFTTRKTIDSSMNSLWTRVYVVKVLKRSGRK